MTDLGGSSLFRPERFDGRECKAGEHYVRYADFWRLVDALRNPPKGFVYGDTKTIAFARFSRCDTEQKRGAA